jgi:hypothetical protein
VSVRFKSSTKTARRQTRFLILLAVLSNPLLAKTSLIQLTSAGVLLSPAALYDCTSIDSEHKCVSYVADDTAHLSENPNAPTLTVGTKIKVRRRKDLGTAQATFYLADESSLLDDPKYKEITLMGQEIELPPLDHRSVLIAIYQQPKQPTKTKVVWLLAPNLPTGSAPRSHNP